MCRRFHVSETYMSGEEEEEETLQAQAGMVDDEGLGRNEGHDEKARRRQERRERKRLEKEGVTSPYFPGVVGKERGVEEWEREVHAEKLRMLKRSAELANVSLTPELLELLPYMRRETVPIHGYKSRIPRNLPRVTAAGYHIQCLFLLQFFFPRNLPRVSAAGYHIRIPCTIRIPYTYPKKPAACI
jgi:hypothetical protein